MEFYMPVLGLQDEPNIRTRGGLQARLNHYFGHPCHHRSMSWNCRNRHKSSQDPLNLFVSWWNSLEHPPEQDIEVEEELEKSCNTEGGKWEKIVLLEGFDSENINVEILSKNRILVEGVKNNSLFKMRYVYVPENVDVKSLKVSYSDGKLVLSADRRGADDNSESRPGEETVTKHEKDENGTDDNEKTESKSVTLNSVKDDKGKHIESGQNAENVDSVDKLSEDVNNVSLEEYKENQSDKEQKDINEDKTESLEDDKKDECDIECEKYLTKNDLVPMVFDAGDCFTKTFNLSQFTAESVKVKVIGDKVIVQAHQVEEADGCVGFNEYYREVELPDDVDADKLTSRMDSEGMLTLTAPNKPRTRDIPVNFTDSKHE